MTTITVISDGETTVEADVRDGRVLLGTTDFEVATGWTLKPEGLCRGSICVPVRDRAAVTEGDRIDLTAIAATLSAPIATEIDLAVVAIGEPAPLRDAALDDCSAPDFTLPRLGGDHEGEPFTFSSIGTKKKLLVAWASW